MKRALGLVFMALVLAACGDAGGGGGGGGGGGTLVGGPGTTIGEGLPPISAVWFGTAYDSGSMQVYDKSLTFKSGSPLVAVGTLFAPQNAADVKVTVETGGSIRATLPLSAGAAGSTYGVDLSAQKFGPGTYLIAFKGASGRPLASASVTITP